MLQMQERCAAAPVGRPSSCCVDSPRFSAASIAVRSAGSLYGQPSAPRTTVIAKRPRHLLDAGDAALVADPGYPVYRGGPAIAGAEAIPLPLRETQTGPYKAGGKKDGNCDDSWPSTKQKSDVRLGQFGKAPKVVAPKGAVSVEQAVGSDGGGGGTPV